MVLLDVLHRLTATQHWRLAVAHFNHQLRGPESEADEWLVQETADRLGLPFVSERWDDPKGARWRPGMSLEMAARAARHDFLGRAAEQRGIPTVAMAHHADDQAELFFLRLLRGAGGEGLGGMKWLNVIQSHPSVKLIRPFLDQPKAVLRAYAAGAGILFREDATNACRDAKRNLIRHELFPLLQRGFQPQVARTILRSMQIVADETECVRQLAERWLGKPHRRGAFDQLHCAMQRQCLRVQLEWLGLAAGFDAVEHLRLSPGRLITLAPGFSVRRDQGGLVHLADQTEAGFCPDQMIVELAASHGGSVFDGVEFSWRIDSVEGSERPPNRKPGCEYFDADKIGPYVCLRHWQKGDRFQPIGLGGEVKVQDLFMNLKIPRAERHRLVLAECMCEHRIFWVEGLRISERFKLDKQTRRRLKWQWHRVGKKG